MVFVVVVLLPLPAIGAIIITDDEEEDVIILDAPRAMKRGILPFETATWGLDEKAFAGRGGTTAEISASRRRSDDAIILRDDDC